MRPNPIGALIGCLCVAVLFVFASMPSQEAAKASPDRVKVSDVDKLIDLVAKIQANHQESLLVQFKVSKQLADSIQSLREQVAAEMVTRADVVRLVSTTMEETKTESLDVCNCGTDCEALKKELESLKTRVTALEAARAATTSPVVSSSYSASSSPVVVKSGGSTGSVTSGGSTGSVSYGSTGAVRYSYSDSQPIDSAPVVNYTPRWQNHDGLSRADHAAVYHGLNTAGMTQAQINAQLDADHDAHGPMHDSIQAARTRSVTRSVMSTASGNCPGGVCPTGPTASRQVRRSGLLGLGLFSR